VFELTSSVFMHNEMIPAMYTCDGEDVSPPLAWQGLPGDARSLVLIVDDPDAPVGTWVHWVLYNLPVSEHSLPEKIAPLAEPLPGASHGRNSWGKLGYGGPCPPGGTHRYIFKLYALDTMLELQPGARKNEVEAQIAGHVLAEARLIGMYSRIR